MVPSNFHREKRIRYSRKRPSHFQLMPSELIDRLYLFHSPSVQPFLHSDSVCSIRSSFRPFLAVEFPSKVHHSALFLSTCSLRLIETVFLLAEVFIVKRKTFESFTPLHFFRSQFLLDNRARVFENLSTRVTQSIVFSVEQRKKSDPRPNEQQAANSLLLAMIYDRFSDSKRVFSNISQSAGSNIWFVEMDKDVLQTIRSSSRLIKPSMLDRDLFEAE